MCPDATRVAYRFLEAQRALKWDVNHTLTPSWNGSPYFAPGERVPAGGVAPLFKVVERGEEIPHQAW